MTNAIHASGYLPEQEAYEERGFGFWLYLMSDTIIFALLFATYLVMVGHSADGPATKSLFSLPHTFGETLLLLSSSLTFGIASLHQGNQNRNGVILWLLATFVLGLGFLALEISEFHGLISRGTGPDHSGALSAFFTLVGTHGLHVSAGLFFILVFIAQLLHKGLTPPVASRLYRLGLFWHFLDIIWIGIFSVVYLPSLT